MLAANDSTIIGWMNTRHFRLWLTLALSLGYIFGERLERAALADEPGGKALLSAAASTKDVVESLAEQFAKTSKHSIKVNPGSSNSLAGQIIAGAPADLFLSASP